MYLFISCFQNAEQKYDLKKANEHFLEATELRYLITIDSKTLPPEYKTAVLRLAVCAVVSSFSCAKTVRQLLSTQLEVM
jgi:hypothetical protein